MFVIFLRFELNIKIKISCDSISSVNRCLNEKHKTCRINKYSRIEAINIYHQQEKIEFKLSFSLIFTDNPLLYFILYDYCLWSIISGWSSFIIIGNNFEKNNSIRQFSEMCLHSKTYIFAGST